MSKYKAWRRKLCGMAALVGGLAAIARVALGRLEFVILSDVLLADSLWSDLFPLFQTLLILLSFALFYGFTCKMIGEIGFTKALPFMFLTISVLLFRFLLTLLRNRFIDRIPEYEFLTSSLPLQVFSLALELAQYLLVLFVIWLTVRLTASLSRSIFFSSLTVLLVNVGSRAIYDIGYGLPTSVQEVLLMIGAYTSDLLLYGVLLFFATHFFSKWAEKLRNKNA